MGIMTSPLLQTYSFYMANFTNTNVLYEFKEYMKSLTIIDTKQSTYTRNFSKKGNVFTLFLCVLFVFVTAVLISFIYFLPSPVIVFNNVFVYFVMLTGVTTSNLLYIFHYLL